MRISRICPASSRTWSGDAGSVLQGREEVNAIAIGIEHRGVALPPGGVPRLGTAFVSCSDEPGVGGIHSTRCPLVKGQGDAVTSRGQLVTRVEATNEVDGVPRQNGAVVEPGIGMRLVAPFRVGCSEQAVEGERASRSRDKHPPWASSGQSSPPSLRPMSILEHLTHDRLERQQENRCRWRGDRNEPRNHDQSTVHRRRAKSQGVGKVGGWLSDL